MRERTSAGLVAVLSLTVACGGMAEEPQAAAREMADAHLGIDEASRGATGSVVPWSYEDLDLPPPVWVKGCRYRLESDNQVPPYERVLTLTRVASPKCVGQTVTIDGPTLFIEPTGLVLAENRGQLVVAWRRLVNPTYSLVYLFLDHVSPETLQVVRWEGIGTYYKWGSILDASVEFKGHRLLVHGTKSGIFSPDEPVGLYPSFTATYPHFFTSTEPPTFVVY